MLFAIELLLLLIGLIGILIAVISDIKTTEVPDYSNYFLIFSGLLLRLIYSIASSDWGFTIEAVKFFPVMFLLASIMYYSKQWGGGDSKLLLGLSIVFAAYPSFLLSLFTPILNLPFPLILFINILLVGAIYTLTYSLVLAVKNRNKFMPALKQALSKSKNLQTIIIFISLILIVFSFILQSFLIKFITLTLAIILVLLFYLYNYLKIVEKICLIKTVPVSRLLEGDWITHNIICKNRIIHKKFQELTKKQILLIKKANIQKVEIRQGIVFTPVFLIGFILSIIFGNIFSYLI